MIRRSTLIAVEILMGLVAALAIGVGIAWWRLSQGPVDLSFLRPTVQTELSAARSGRPVGIARVELTWSPQGALLIRAVDVTVEDGRGHVLSRSQEARIELGVLPLLIGRIQVKSAEFVGGEITLTRKIDDALQIAFGPEGSPPDIIIPASQTNETLEQKVARLLDGMEAAFRPIGAGGGLRAISIRGARLAIIDEKGGGRWTADAAQFELARQGRNLVLEANARLEAATGQAPASLRITTDTRFQSAVIEFGTQNVRPRALFSPAALGPFAGLDTPLTATVSIGLDRAAGINRFEGEAVLGRGTAEMAGGRFDLRGGRIHGRYDIESDELIIDELALGGARTRVGGEAHLRNVSAIFRAAPNTPAAFDISLPSLTLDVPGTFEEPLAFSNLQAVGAIDSATRTISLTRFRAQTGEAVLNAAGRLYWAEAGADHRLHPGVELNGNISGALEARTVTHVWPMGLGEGARGFLARTLEAGRVTDAVVRLDIRPSDTAAGVMRNEAVDVRFNISGAAMRFISTMSPVTGARGSAVLRGNSFEMTIPEARMNDLVLTNGRIDVPRFKPGGDYLSISARADGDARRLLEVLVQEPINLRERLPVDVATATGRSSVNIRLQRPMQHDVQFEDWRFTVDGGIRDFAGTMTSRGHVALSQGQLTVRGDQRAITVSGPVHAGASAIQNVRWTQRIGALPRGVSSSEYQISGDFDARDLEHLGYSIAEYAEGRVGVTVTGQGRGFDVDNARVDVDLTRAAVESPWRFWTKSAGQTANVRFNVERQTDGSLMFNNLDARGGGLNTQGRVLIARDGRIMQVDLTRLLLEGQSDSRVTATRAADGGLDIAVRGALFDAAPFMGSSGEEEATPTAQVAGAPAVARPVEPPVRASVIVDRLKMRGGATLSNARVDLITARGALATLVAEGQSPGGRAFSLAMGPRQTDPQGHIRFRSDDAGFAVRALTGSDNVVGGTASADGDWRGGPPTQGRFNVRLRNFQVVRLPAMARLLSSAGSLTGMVEMLNGDGIGFSALDAQMAYGNNRVTFTEGAMRGPSLGLTGSGSYDIRRDNLDIDGVVAPSPTLNLSMLGNVPVLGDLLVSRRGEGVFGMTYSINGHAGEPRVGVNPVSALTPGIFRRIFEPAPTRDSGGTHSLPANDNAAVGEESVAPQAEASAASAP